MFLLLSHILSTKTPAYDVEPTLILKPHRQIEKRDSSNSYILELQNHLGTHVDAPNHFHTNGRKISEFRIEELVFQNVPVLDTPKSEGELIVPKDFEGFEGELGGAEMFLLRTGFERYRESDKQRFSSRGPCFSAAAASFLQETYHKLRGIGIDTISLSSPLQREEGREAHRILLSKNDFIIVEDMRLSEAVRTIRRLIIVPLFVEEVDSAPCMVLAEL